MLNGGHKEGQGWAQGGGQGGQSGGQTGDKRGHAGDKRGKSGEHAETDVLGGGGTNGFYQSYT